MSGSWLSILALLLSVATLAAIGAGFPAPGALGGGPIEALAACALHLQFAALALLSLVTSRSWRSTQPTFSDGGWPSLRSLAYIAPLFTLAQIALGAAYRYRQMGVIPHVVWAFVAAIVLLMFGAFLITQKDAGAPLKKLAVALVTLVSLQVILGVAALLARVADLTKAAWMPVATTAHLVTGALVLACSLLISAFVLRCAQTAPSSSQLASNGSHS